MKTLNKEFDVIIRVYRGVAEIIKDSGLKVAIFDYDIEDAREKDLKVDENGNQFILI